VYYRFSNRAQRAVFSRNALRHYDGRMAVHDERSDIELVAVCNTGGPKDAAAAFETLYRRHRDYVLRVARRFARDRELALDALQETFTYLLKKFPPAGPGLVLTARMQTLLYPVAKHCAISALRRADCRGNDDVLPDELPAEPAAEHVPLDAALANLSPERREVVTLRFVDDLSLEDIAIALEIPLGTVKSRLHLAIKQLREDPRIKDLFAL
jgi:RNA polymerase sigma-70 factor (ECF subfamily)